MGEAMTTEILLLAILCVLVGRPERLPLTPHIIAFGAVVVFALDAVGRLLEHLR